MIDVKDMKPEDLRRMNSAELRQVAEVVRQEIVQVVSKNGGHLAPSLGTVELTLALHTVFDTPRDRVVWDVGHQAYAHKIVTGRGDVFPTLRQQGGISGFLKRAESEYDVYDAGHASGAISFALGLAKARDLRGEDHHVVAVIGDGSMTSGVAFEGLNNAGGLGSRLIVVLNDNAMSISENVGGLNHYFTALRLAPVYRTAKERLERVLDRMPSLGPSAVRILRRVKGGVKHLLFPGSWFQSLGFGYYGPIDGHDIEVMQRVLGEAKTLATPAIVHVVTKKGKGYPPAEADPERFHGASPFDPETGQPKPSGDKPPAWNKVFGEAVTAFARENPKIVAITAAMCDGTGLGPFKSEFPERFFDVGIAESHAVTFAAGLNREGFLPVVAIYSTFLQRSYDQIVQDVAQEHLKVIFAIDRAGLVGEDGETHHGAFDIGYLRTVPGLVLMAPKDEPEMVDMFYTALCIPQSAAVRYPRGEAPGVPYEDSLRSPKKLDVGVAQVFAEGEDVNILAVGSLVNSALSAMAELSRQGVSCGVTNARFMKPFDEATVTRLVQKAPLVVLEENVSAGGLGEAVGAFASALPGQKGVLPITLPDAFVTHGTQSQVRAASGLDVPSLVTKIRHYLGEGR